MPSTNAEKCWKKHNFYQRLFPDCASIASTELAAMMFSLFQTLLLWQLNPHHWLYSYLTACAENGGQPPADITPFIPWMMSEERKQQLAKPMPGADSPIQAHASLAQPP